jgi:hypothetical protein
MRGWLKASRTAPSTITTRRSAWIRTYAAAYYSRGRAYEKKGDIDRARASYRAALVPPRERKLKIQDRIQDWAQSNATKRLKELDEQPAK